jgi:hypothetical protein
MANRLCFPAAYLIVAASLTACAQQSSQAPQAPDVVAIPEANPGRPTVATPATLTPIGYLQFETGILAAWNSPGVISQTSINEVIKYSLSARIQILASTEPYAHSNAPSQPANGTGDVDLGAQGVVHQGEGANPTVAVSYFGRVYSGDSPDLDIGSFRNSVLLLASADVKGFHYDANFIADEVVDNNVRRAQLGQTISISHGLSKNFGLTGELWHFNQPFLNGNAIGNLWAVNYNARKNVVLDCGFDRGLTSTSAQWEAFAGFTYLFPHKLPLTWHEKTSPAQGKRKDP